MYIIMQKSTTAASVQVVLKQVEIWLSSCIKQVSKHVALVYNDYPSSTPLVYKKCHEVASEKYLDLACETYKL